MMIAMAGFTLNDTLVKFASSDLNMGQIMLVRGVFASSLILLLAWRHGAFEHAGRLLRPTVLLRMVGETGATVTFLMALAHLPLANVSAVMQALPLAVTMCAALFMAEPVGWRRWSAVAIGFVGVLIVVRPGLEGFSIYALYALASVGFCVMRDLITRKIPPTVPTPLVAVTTSLSVTLTGAVLTPVFGGWRPLTIELLVVLAGAGTLLLFGYHFIIAAMRSGDISFVSPFRYTALLWALALGYLVFGDVPDLAMIVGSAVIVASGLYMLYRERIVGRHAVAAGSRTLPAAAPEGL